MRLKFKALYTVLAIILTCSFITCSAASADFDFDLSINNDTGVVTVVGTLDSRIDKKITMIAYYPDVTGSITKDNIKNMIYTIDETYADENGEFGFEFTITDACPGGEYKVYLGVEDVVFAENDRSGKVNYIDSVSKGIKIGEFASKSTASELDTFFGANPTLFILPDYYGPTTYETFNNIVIEYRDTYYVSGVAKFEDVKTIIKVSDKIKELSEITTANDFSSFIMNSENSALLGIDTTDEYYLDAQETDVSKKNKTLVDSKIFSLVSAAATPVAKWKAIENNFKSTVILTALNNAAKSEIDGILKTYSLELGIDVSGSYLLVDPVEMAKPLYSQNFTLLSQIAPIFNSTLASLVSPGDSGSGVGSAPDRREPGFSVSGGSTFVPVVNNNFTDIASVPWAAESITELKNRGIIDGISPTQFAPGSNVTREQFVKLVVGAFGSQWTKGDNSFTDVSDSSWYAGYVSRAVNAGIINGQAEGIFGVGKNITRQDVAVILYRIMKDKIPAPVVEPSFKDWNNVSSYAKDAVAAMWSEKILSGDDKGYFNPAKSCTRAEAAKLIYGAIKLVEGV